MPRYRTTLAGTPRATLYFCPRSSGARLMKKWFASLLFVVAAHAMAAPSCTEFTPNAQWPVLVNPKMAPKTRMLCYTDFAVLHSGYHARPVVVCGTSHARPY